MALRLRRRLGRYGLTVVVVALGTLIIGVAFALITVQITGTVASNEFATTTTTVAPTTTTTVPGDGLQAAISTGGGDTSSCETAFNQGSVSLGAVSFDLNNGNAQSYAPQMFLCVRNSLAGGENEISTLTVQAIVVSSTEDGCSGDEETTDPDGPGCGTAGELETVVDVLLLPVNMGDSGCFNSGQIVALGGSSMSLLNSPTSALSFGSVCSWEVKLMMNGSSTYEQKLAASTDSIALTLDVEGSGA